MLLKLRTLPIRHVDGDQLGSEEAIEVDQHLLQKELEQGMLGEVRFDAASRAMYAHDASNYRMIPIGVVIPKCEEDVEHAVRIARKFGAPVIPRGGGTGIPGQSVNAALMIDFTKYMDRILEIDPEEKTVLVEPGCIPDSIKEAGMKYGLLFWPDPATHARNTIGGMIGNNSCGVHSLVAGRTSENVERLDVLLYDGTRMTVGPTTDEELESIVARGGRKAEIYTALRTLRDRYADLIRERYPRIPRRISGFNLDELLPENGFNVARALVGSEGTCAIVLKAWCKLRPAPKSKVIVLLAFADVGSAGDFVPTALRFNPLGCEGMDQVFLEDMHLNGVNPKHKDLFPPGQCWLLIEFGDDTKEEAKANARRLIDSLTEESQVYSHRLIEDDEQQKGLYEIREEGLGATAIVLGEKVYNQGWEDSAVPPDQMGQYLRDFKALMDRSDFGGSIYGHWGDGCLHIALDFDLETKPGIEKYSQFVHEATALVLKHGGSLSGEHGDGQARGELLERMFGRELIEAFQEFKKIWDPDWKMNPGKLIAPYGLDENLMYGTGYAPPQIQTHFQFPGDRHTFSFAARRCVGAGVCRRHNSGTMCPSYMVTHEEKHSTRGRARLLFEMIEGDVIKDGWQSEEVKEALDLCLSCKGCKGECPVQVDMATYKAEFLSHYYEKKRRPRQAYLFGFIQVWARFAGVAPGFINLMGRLPGLRALIKKMAGVDLHRKLPTFAPYTFQSWWASRPKKNIGMPAVILWADTFNNHFHPTIAQAAVEVLEDAGFCVQVSRQNLCCGRPLYDYGFLDHAAAYLGGILETMRGDIRNGAPIVVLEPSCCSVFREELPNLFANDEDALRLSKQVYLLGEFLVHHAPGYQPPSLHRKAILHGHCHQKALFGMDDDRDILKRMGVEFETPDTGCCGMAGGFGFEEGEHFDVSVKCGERVLLPEVRNTPAETLIVADGFSCREQVSQLTDRVPLHLAQVIKMGLDEDSSPRPLPEKRYVKVRSGKDEVKTAALVGLCVYGAYRLVKAALKSREHRS